MVRSLLCKILEMRVGAIAFEVIMRRSLLRKIWKMSVGAIALWGDYGAINVKEKTCKYLYDAKI